MKSYFKSNRWIKIGVFSILSLSLLGSACSKKKGPISDSGGPEVYSIDLEMIHFDYDKYTIKSEFEGVLKKHAEWLKTNPKTNIVIEGHTDKRGTEEYNLALGERRAIAAKNFLVNLGISPDRISTISFGKTKQIDFGESEASYYKNRRDEFKGIKK